MLEYILFIIGVFFLVKGANYLVDGSTSLAEKWNISKLVVGLTVVAFGTSAPELFINAIAAFNNEADIAVGNIIGSNISNILLVLGVLLLISNIKIKDSVIKKDVPYSFLAGLLLLVLALIFGLELTRTSGIILLLFFAFFMYKMYKEEHLKVSVIKQINKKQKKSFLIWANIIGGIILLYFGGEFVVNNAIKIALSFGLSEYTVALTIVAVGTSLPELVTSITAGIKKQADIGIGNIVGSNIFNILWVLGITALIRPISLHASAITDITILLLASAILFLTIILAKKKLTRTHGIIFLVMYIAYILFLLVR